MSKADDIFLERRLYDLPGSLETGTNDHAVAGGKSPRCGAVLRHNRNAGKHSIVFPLGVNDAPFAGRSFPDARVQRARLSLDFPVAKTGIPGKDAIRRRRALFRDEAIDREIERECFRHRPIWMTFLTAMVISVRVPSTKSENRTTTTLITICAIEWATRSAT